MLKILVKKQLFEIFKGWFYDSKKKEARTKASSIVFITVYALILVALLGGIFAFVSYSLCTALVGLGYTWLYFAITGLIGMALGIFGSVFNTYSGLYLAKDNDLLLSLPIPTGYILISRLIGVYFLGLVFSLTVTAPAVIVYFCCVSVGVLEVIGALLMPFAVSLIVFVITCILGFFVAQISKKLKNKSIITVIAAIVAIALYYYVYGKVSSVLSQIVQYADSIGSAVTGYGYPLYMFGKAAAGDPLQILLQLLIIGAATAITFAVLNNSFIKIATSSANTATKSGATGFAKKESSVSKALFARDLARFSSSPTYMLNASLGTVFLLAAAVFIAINGFRINEALRGLLGSTGIASVMVAGGICLIGGMNFVSAVSVSIEGEQLWILRSSPVGARQVLRSKLKLHYALTAIPAVIALICTVIAFQSDIFDIVILTLLVLSYILLSDCFGLIMDLRHPQLSWTSDIIPVKQKLSNLAVMMTNFVYAALTIAGAYLVTQAFGIGYLAYAAIVAGVNCFLCLLAVDWIQTKGEKIFNSL